MSTLASVVEYGLFSALPAAGITGRIYYCSDPSGSHEGEVLRDNGTSFDILGYFGTSGGGGLINFADNETPSGTVNGTNPTFTLAHTPNPSVSLQFTVNGVLQIQGTDYTLSTGTITATNIPITGAILRAFYRY
jgi:hypothetical protein